MSGGHGVWELEEIAFFITGYLFRLTYVSYLHSNASNQDNDILLTARWQVNYKGVEWGLQRNVYRLRRPFLSLPAGFAQLAFARSFLFNPSPLRSLFIGYLCLADLGLLVWGSGIRWRSGESACFPPNMTRVRFWSDGKIWSLTKMDWVAQNSPRSLKWGEIVRC